MYSSCGMGFEKWWGGAEELTLEVKLMHALVSEKKDDLKTLAEKLDTASLRGSFYFVHSRIVIIE